MCVEMFGKDEKKMKESVYMRILKANNIRDGI